MPKRDATLAGVVLGEQGYVPCAGCRVAIQPVRHPLSLVCLDERTVLADDEGRFEFSGLRPGIYELWALRDEDGRVARKGDIEIREGLKTMVEVSFTSAQECLLVPLWKLQTHYETKREAVEMLEDHDGEMASFFNNHISVLESANFMEDAEGSITKDHFYHWSTGKGFHISSGLLSCFYYSDAATKCDSVMSLASSYWKKGSYSDAMYQLGRAAHLVQDLCVPFHAECVDTKDKQHPHHASFEAFVRDNWDEIKPEGPTPIFAPDIPTAGGWVSGSAQVAKEYWGCVSGTQVNTESWMSAAKECVKEAKQRKAGFFDYCWHKYFGC